MGRIVCYGGMVLCTLLLSLAEAADLTVTIVGLRSTEGVVRLSVYNRAETFLEDNGRIARHRENVAANPMQVTFDRTVPGTYAISVVHDENDDGKLNRNILGLPLEGYGFSNDAPVVLGPPSFEKGPCRWGRTIKHHYHAHHALTLQVLSTVGVDQRPVTASPMKVIRTNISTSTVKVVSDNHQALTFPWA